MPVWLLVIPNAHHDLAVSVAKSDVDCVPRGLLAAEFASLDCGVSLIT
jgi:hypothetical protein